MTTTMKFNSAFFEALERSPQVMAKCESVANQVAAVARANAPVDTGAYASLIHVETKIQGRAVALVRADDPASMVIESRTGNLLRALRAVVG
jgi:hypothetical protein